MFRVRSGHVAATLDMINSCTPAAISSAAPATTTSGTFRSLNQSAASVDGVAASARPNIVTNQSALTRLLIPSINS